MTEPEIKQGKPTTRDIEALGNFLEWLEGEAESPGVVVLETLHDRFAEIPSWRRVVHGCATLVENCCDPALDYIDWKPEIKRALEPSETRQNLEDFISDRVTEINQRLAAEQEWSNQNPEELQEERVKIAHHQGKLFGYASVASWLRAYGMSDSSWRVTAEVILERFNLLPQLSPGESVTPDRFQDLTTFKLSQLIKERDVCRSTAQQLIHALKVNINGEPGEVVANAIAKIEQLRDWKQLAKYACKELNVCRTACAVPSTDAIDGAIARQRTLRNAIARWAGECGQHWDSARFDIAETLAQELLVEIAGNPDATADLAALIGRTDTLSLADAISAWCKSVNEEWDSTRLNIAESLTKQLLTAVAERLELPENPDEMTVAITTNREILKDAIDSWAFYVKGESWSADLLSAADKAVTRLLEKILDMDVESINDLNFDIELVDEIEPSLTSEVDLKSAIDTWARIELRESWHSRFLGYATKLVVKLLKVIREHNSIGPLTDLASLCAQTEARSLADAIAQWGTQQNADWMKDARFDQVVSIVEKVLKQYTAGKLGVYQAFIGQTGIYRVPHPEESSELEQICPLQTWSRLAEYVTAGESTLSLRQPSRSTLADRAIAVLQAYKHRHSEQLSEFQSFQSDVISYLRAMVLVVEAAANGGTHAEKNARFRGVISLLETSIDKVHNARSTFVSSHWWSNPDLFRSDYPVRSLIDRIKAQEAELQKLKGEQPRSAVEDIAF
jgi:hypothetical protein